MCTGKSKALIAFVCCYYIILFSQNDPHSLLLFLITFLWAANASWTGHQSFQGYTNHSLTPRGQFHP